MIKCVKLCTFDSPSKEVSRLSLRDQDRICAGLIQSPDIRDLCFPKLIKIHSYNNSLTLHVDLKNINNYK